MSDDNGKNNFAPAAVVLAMGVAFALMIWAAGHAKGAELDGGTVLAPVKADKIDAAPWKIAIGTLAVDDEGVAHPVTFGVIGDGFATEEKCMGKQGAADPAFKSMVQSMARRMSEQTGITVRVVAGCVDIRKLPPGLRNGAVKSFVPPPPGSEPPQGEKL